jgi:hypothetical protein
MLIKVAATLGVLPHQRVRRYKVTLFGETLGTFTLPIGDHMQGPDAFVRSVLTRPFRMEFGEDTFFYWAEPTPDGSFKMVQFHPLTSELREEGVRFYNAAHGLNADGSPDPGRQPPLVIRTAEEMRLIRAAVENRDAEQPYRDYAAWLDAKGDTFGEYIRLTLEIEQFPEGDERRERPEARREKLVARHGPRWVLPLANTGIYPGVYVGDFDGYYPTIFHGKKGVIEELDVDSNALVFPHNAARLFYAAPFLRKLSVSHGTLTVGEFASVPQFAQLEALALSVAHGTANDVRVFAESPHLGGLRALKLSGCGIGAEGAEHLARAAWFSGLRSLDLGSNSLGDPGAEAIALGPTGTNLTALDLRYNNLTDRGLIALCQAPHLAQLEVLNLESNAFTAEGIGALAAAPFARTLTSLNLNGTQLDAAALAALAAGAFPALKTLDISYCDAGDEGVRAVAAAPVFRTLEVFRANSTGAGDATAGAIAALGFVALCELELTNNALSDTGAAALVGSKAVTKLTKLNLNDNPFGVAGTLALAGADLPRLEHLDLCRVACGPEGARALAGSPHFKSLKTFWISEDRVGPAGRAALIKRFTDAVMTFIS